MFNDFLNVYFRTFHFLSEKNKRKFTLAMFIGVFVSLLDLLGVILFGILGAVAINGIDSKPPGLRASKALDLLGLSNLDLNSLALVLGILVSLILSIRTIISIRLTKGVLIFLNHQAASISGRLLNRYLLGGLEKSRHQNSQEVVYSITQGVNNLMSLVLGTTVSVVSDIAISLVLICGILIVSLMTGFFTIFMFGGIAFFLYKYLNDRSQVLSWKESELSIKSNLVITQILFMFREIYVSDKSKFFSEKIENLRHKFADITSEKQFLPNISKYVLESAILIGTLLLTGLQFALNDASRAIATLSIFMISGARIGPSVLRIQQGVVTIKAAMASSKLTFELLDLYEKDDYWQNEELDNREPDFKPQIVLKNVYFNFNEHDREILKNVSFKINEGSSVAIVGPSGSGKSTLIDVILGLLQPTQGEVSISGLPPVHCVRTFVGSIAYVPQEAKIFEGTIRENIAFGRNSEEIDDKLVRKCISIACLERDIENLENGIYNMIYENGNNLSGGQKQRIGIARALYSSPRLLVIDEGTSSLDGITEHEVMTRLKREFTSTTQIIVAHRLSTILEVDKVIYLEEGKIIAEGSFDEVKLKVPNFEKQANLMGL